MSDSPFGTWNGVESHPMFPGVSLHAVGGEQVLLCRVDYEPGTTVARHSHEATEQLMYVVSGDVTLTIGDETRELRAGDVCAINRERELCRTPTQDITGRISLRRSPSHASRDEAGSSTRTRLARRR